MIYTNIDSICLAAINADLSNPDTVKSLQALFKVYNDALNNPPSGIVGVGAITYAEQVLIDYQLNNAESV